MTDEAAFLAAIKAAPDDDLPRLVYADWLDEHGEADRAEFVRLDCELAVKIWPCECGADNRCGCACPESVNLRTRVRDLLDAHADGWLGAPLPVHPGGVTWRRGFVGVVACPAGWWVTHADAVLARHPVRKVVLTTRPQFDSATNPQDQTTHYPVAGRVVRVLDVVVRVLDVAATGCGRPWELAVLALRWPGVEFILPAEPTRIPPADPLEAMTDAELLDVIRSAAVRAVERIGRPLADTLARGLSAHLAETRESVESGERAERARRILARRVNAGPA